ncbi:MAG: MogA/MoaB family molybdenum cofactor biosynthesis protein [Methanotrichaceae archaeon]|nr:MogA/MoaB family molybdenum cofactor biosynthesis protein [Methanotrichaceae archaeon]
MQIQAITVSTSRFRLHGSVFSPKEADDISGEAIIDGLERAGHITTYMLLPDEMVPLREAILECSADALIICGGTGLGPEDVTIEAAEPLYRKAIPGFGEIFRQRAYEEVGTRAILTRASAGVVGQIPVFCLPGSPSAARLGLDLILMELDHMLKHIRRG